MTDRDGRAPEAPDDQQTPEVDSVPDKAVSDKAVSDRAMSDEAGTGEAVPTTAVPKKETVLEQMGGLSGLVSSTLPVIAFVPANSFFGLTVAIWTALAVALGVMIWRLVQRTPIQPAISGFFGVGICAFIAYRTGDAKGYFLFGIYTSLVYGAVFVVSIIARWPLVGVAWGYLNGTGTSWRSNRRSVYSYDIATFAWAVVFGARYLVQSQLYDSDHTGWLAVARIGMGWPLTGVALLVTFWAVRRADKALVA